MQTVGIDKMLCVVKPVLQYVQREVVWKKTNYPFQAKARVTDGIIKGHYESTLVKRKIHSQIYYYRGISP